MLLALIACQSGAVIGPVDPGQIEVEEPDDTGLENIPGIETSELFQLERVVEIELEISDEGWDSLRSDPYTYVEAQLTIDDRPYASVGVRIKGRLGSLRTLPNKAALKIDFQQFGGSKGPDGLKKLNLNNMVQDCAQAHEFLSYGIHRDLGIPAPRVAYAWVQINHQDYGLYTLVDVYDDVFLERTFDDPSGNLYDGDYHLYPDNSYDLVDFHTGTQHLFELDEGDDVGFADVYAVTAARDEGFDAVGQVVDLDAFATFLGISAWTGHYDSYAYYTNNYRLYFDPGRDGKAVFLPWDPDWAFYSSTPVTSGTGVIAQGCLADADCREKAHDAAAHISATLPGSALERDLVDIYELTEDYIQDDPKRESGVGQIESCRADLLDWIDRRQGELDSYGF
ncbi:MAG: hypothetical protein GY884_15230 [Proteobacteria bacterium]|nr:hypothetical protein [Pseudomonadota bacterium]